MQIKSALSVFMMSRQERRLLLLLLLPVNGQNFGE